MPPKLRELIVLLEKKGFKKVKGGKGSHIKLKDGSGITVILSGNLGKDAKHWQVKNVKEKLKQRQKNLGKLQSTKTPSQVLADKRAKSKNDKGFSR